MKKRLSTKVLAIFMAVLMLVTAVPFVAFANTHDPEADPVGYLQEEITAYETVIKEHNVLENMADAYTAYVNAVKALDVYNYGTADAITASKLVEYANTLHSAVYNEDGTLKIANRLDPAAQIANKYPLWNGAEDTKSNEMSSMVLWTKNSEFNSCTEDIKISKDNKGAIFGQPGWGNFYIQYGTSVMLYDGDTTPALPIMGWSRGHSVAPARKAKYPAFFSTWCTDTANFDINYGPATGWSGYKDFSLKSYTPKYSDNFVNASILRADVCTNNSGNKLQDGNNDWSYSYSSTLRFIGNLDNNTYIAPFKPQFNSYFYFAINDTDYHGQGDNVAIGNDVKIVNYKPVKDALDGLVNSNVLNNISQFTESYDDVVNYMTAIDNAYKFNPTNGNNSVNPVPQYRNNYNYDEDFTATINQVEADIRYIVGSLNNNNIAFNAGNYDLFKTSITNAEVKVAAGNTLYTSSSWGKLTDALDKAHAHFADMSKLYTSYGNLKLNLDTAMKEIAEGGTLEKKANFTPIAEEPTFSANNFVYTVASLEAMANAYNSADRTYTNMSPSDRDNTPADPDNALIQKEHDDIVATLNKDKLVEFQSTIPELMAALDGAIDNTDKYSVKLLKDFMDGQLEKYSPEDGVKIANATVRGIDVDAYYRDALENLNQAQWPYKVTVDGTPLKDEEGNEAIFHYGDEIELPANTNGYLVEVKADETDKTITSRAKGGDTLVVRGNMVVTSCDAPASETTTFVKFLSSVTGKVMYVDSYTKGDTVNFADIQSKLTAPAFYEFKGFTVKGEACENVVAEGEEIIVWVQFKAVEKPGVYDVVIGGKQLEPKQYNAQVTAKIEGAYGYRDKDTKTVLWIGDTYKFSVSEDIEIEALTEAEAEEAKTKIASYAVSAPIYSNGTTTITGSYSNADVKVVSQGIIIDKKNKFAGGEYTLADVSNAQSVANYSITNVDSANQYALLLRGQSGVAYSYRTYVTYEYEYKDGEDTKKATKTVYSAVREAQPPQA